MNLWLIFLLTFSAHSLNAAIVKECGEYTAKGIFRQIDGKLVLVVNEKTRSENIISLPEAQQEDLTSYYLDTPISAVVTLNKKFNGTRGIASTIAYVDFRLPEPLKPDSTGLKLKKKVACQ